MNAWYKELKPLVDAGLSTYQIAQQINISQTTVRYRLKKCNLKTLIIKSTDLLCKYCSKQLIKNQTHFCSKEHKVLYYQLTHSCSAYPSQKIRRQQRKQLLVDRAGGKCVKCGYNNNLTALEFHHNNPVLKDFELNSGNCARKSLASLFKEADKCILLCSNCHMEFHNPEYNKQ